MREFFLFVATLDSFQIFGLILFTGIGAFLIGMVWTAFLQKWFEIPYAFDRTLGIGAASAFVCFLLFFFSGFFLG